MADDTVIFDEIIVCTYTGKLLVLSKSEEGPAANPRLLPLTFLRGELEHFGLFDDNLTGFNYPCKRFLHLGIGIPTTPIPMTRPHPLRKAMWNSFVPETVLITGNGKSFTVMKTVFVGNYPTNLSGQNLTSRLLELLRSEDALAGSPNILNYGIPLRKGSFKPINQYDETITLAVVGAVDLQFDETIYTTHEPFIYDSTIYLYTSIPELISTTLTFTSEPVKLFNNTILLYGSSVNTYDNTIYLTVTVNYDGTINLVKSNQFDEKIYLWKIGIVEWDELINIIHTTHNNFDELIGLTNNPQYVGFDSQILLVGTGSPTLNEKIILYKIILGDITFDEIINIQSTIKFDETILLTGLEKSIKQYTETILLKKTGTKTFNNTIYLSKSGPLPTGRSVVYFNYTIELIKTGFDEIILISRKPVCQVGDMVRSDGRAVGIMVSGVEFTI